MRKAWRLRAWVWVSSAACSCTQAPAPLQGTITGHAAPLPPAATRCINCHALGTAGSARAASAPSSFGPLLTQRIARRGGPPSAYDEATLCRLLRTGIDPTYVLIPRDMPRYDVTDADCRGLWLYLTSLT